MKVRVKDILIMLNTGTVAGMLFYFNLPDPGGACIIGLIVFVACMFLYSLRRSFRKRPPGNY